MAASITSGLGLIFILGLTAFFLFLYFPGRAFGAG